MGNFFQYTSWTIQGHTSNEDYAGFGQINAKLGNGFSASVGGRWTETESHNNVDLWDYGSYFLDIQSQKSSDLTWKGSIDWTGSEGDYLYAFVATGYTGGGLNTFTGPTGGPAPFGKVTDTDYEAGWKRSSWFNGHLRTELDAFYTDYNHFQVTLSDPNTPLSTYEINLPKATVLYGAEGEAQAVFGNLSFTGNLGLLKSKIANFWTIDPRYSLLASPYVAPFYTCDPAKGGNNPYCVNVKGNPITYAPSVTYNLAAQYTFHVGGGDTLTPRISFAHVAPQWASIFDTPDLGDRLGARNLLGAQVEYETGSWLIALYGDNLTNQQYVTANNSGGLYAGNPRQFGVRVTKVF
jgi:iron complex outermembrane receptor protein